jgi:hypothetical protein
MMSPKIDFAAKRKIVDVFVEDLGETITIQALSVSQLDALKGDNASVELLAQSIVDKETRQTMYTATELSQLSIASMKQLSEEIAALNGFGGNLIDEQTKKYLASLENNSSSV